MGDLHLELHFGVDLASDRGVLEALAPTLGDLGFGTHVVVLEYERDRGAAGVALANGSALRRAVVEKGCSRGPLFEQLTADETSPHARRFGSVLLRGTLKRTWLSVRFDEYVPAMPIGDQWLFSNSISLTTAATALAGRPAHLLARELATRLGAESSLLWGAGYDTDEFRASNLLDDQNGSRALGRDVRRALPGVFWLNLFGTPYLDLIGRDTVASATAAMLAITAVGESIMLECYSSPNDWPTGSAEAARRATRAHLGDHHFFDRNHPERATVAPDFGLPELTDPGSLHVVTSDGKHFTVIPRSAG